MQTLKGADKEICLLQIKVKQSRCLDCQRIIDSTLLIHDIWMQIE